MTSLRELIDGAIRTNMLIGLQDAELFDESGRERINDWADWISENAAKAVQPELDRYEKALREIATFCRCTFDEECPSNVARRALEARDGA